MAGPLVGFSSPFFLVLLLALPGIFLLGRRARRDRRTRAWPSSLWLRLGTAACLVLALAGLHLPAPPRAAATVFVLDFSDSVPADVRDEAKAWVRGALARAGPDDLAAIVTFGRDARVEQPLGRTRDHPVWGDPPLPDASDVAGALRLAGSLLPPAQSGSLRRIVLLSDGNETEGQAQRSLLQPALRGVEIAVLALPLRQQDAAIASFTVPPALRSGEPAELRLGLISPGAQTGTLRVWAQGGAIDQLVYEQLLELAAGPAEIAVATGALTEGSWAFKAQLAVDGDPRTENNESWAYTIVGPAAKVLLLEGLPDEAGTVRDALDAAGILVERMRPQQLPVLAERLEAYEAVVLANVHGADLRRDQMQALKRYVAESGRGLVLIGGERTFGLGEYADTPLEEALPVTVQPPEREQASSLALVLVVDRSGSMSGSDTGDRRTTRMELAKEGAIQAVETLKEGDQVGVVSFDYTPRWVAEVRTVRGPGDVRAVADRIATVQPDGGTDIYSALDYAHRGLQQVQARVKHIILLTDGEQGSPAPFVPLINSMRRSGITLSTVGVSGDIGSRAQADMQDWARRGQGRYYFTNTARDVPRIMTQEARLAGRSFVQERDFAPRLVTAAPAVRGLVPNDFPALHGYVRVSPRPGAETVLTSDQEEVILAEWQYGLGRALVWTGDAQGEWSRDWAGSDAAKRLWPQAVRWTMPAPSTPGLQVAIAGDGERAAVVVESFDVPGQYRNSLQTVADVALPDGTSQRVPLPQSAPGRYEGRFSAAAPGVYFVRVSQSDPQSGRLVARQTVGYALPHLPEYAVNPANRVLLERLAAETGGPLMREPADAWAKSARLPWQAQPVWPELLAAALVLFVADVAVRRLRPTRRDFAFAAAAAGGARRLGRRLTPSIPFRRPRPPWRGPRRPTLADRVQ
jgi:Mg-chelatase subunit ChlD